MTDFPEDEVPRSQSPPIPIPPPSNVQSTVMCNKRMQRAGLAAGVTFMVSASQCATIVDLGSLHSDGRRTAKLKITRVKDINT